jgi:geranylgeranyl reductase family protein
VERFDAIVVGAGPAGSVTAVHLARAGARVLVVDKARFPRDKPCGGGLTIRAVRELPVSVDPVVEHVVDRIGLRLDYGTRVERRGRAPLVLMTQRIRLDEHLAKQAAAVGADFRDGVKVTDIVADDAGVSVRVDGEHVEAAALVGADGVNGPVRKALGLGGTYVLGVALEANVANDVVGERYRGVAELELGIIPGGYAWVFPKGDHVNVGVGGWEREGPTLRSHLAELCRQHGIASEAVESIRGHRLPLRKPGSVSARGRALLVGDAAGLVDPLSGDGMYEAFVSARLASAAVLELLEGRAAALDSYTTALASSLGSLVSASWGAKVALDRYPRATFALGRSALAWRVMERMLRGEILAPSEARGLTRVPLKAIEALARRAGDPGRSYRLEATPA